VPWNEGFESRVPGMKASFRSGVLRVSEQIDDEERLWTYLDEVCM
jgi:hypothetical protein